MHLRWLALLLGTLALGSMQTTIHAQNGFPRVPNSPPYRPGLSPYLNLLRGGDPAANYYLGTRPEVERRQNDRIFASELQRLRSQPSADLDPEDADLQSLRVSSGHPTTFGNTGSFFNINTPPVQRRAPAPPVRRGRR